MDFSKEHSPPQTYTGVWLVIVMSLIAVTAILAPRFMGMAPAMLAVIGCLAWRKEQGRWPVLNKGFLLLVVLLIGLSALSSLWAIDSDFALKRSFKMTIVLAPAIALFSLIAQIREDARRHIIRILPFAVALAGVLCVIDLYVPGALYSLSHENKTPEGSEFNLSLLNRGIIVFSSLILPALYAVRLSETSQKNKALLYAMLLLPLAFVLYYTHSQSAQIAILVAALFWFMFPVRMKAAWFALGIIMVAGVLLAPWIVQFLYDNMAQHVTGFDHWFAHAYAAHRLEIWDFVARKALESPLYGFGIEATRHIEHFDTQKIYTPHDHVLHPHNALLQIWIEFGALGAVCVLAFIAYIFKHIRALNKKDDRRFALAVFMSLFLVANTAYGMWQGWWLGLLVFIAACVILLCQSQKNTL